MRYLHKYSQDEIDFRLDNYFKFFVVRNPFDRLLSSYRDKFRGEPLNFSPMFSGVIEEHFGNNTKRDSSGRQLIDVEQFLELVAEEPRRFTDSHWSEYIGRCNPCSIRYDHVVYLETLEHDIDVVFDHMIGLDGTRPVIPRRNSKNAAPDKDKHNDVLRTIDPEIVRGLHKRYDRDFELFGYTWNNSAGTGCVKGVC